MSLRTFQRVTIMSILALGALGASGCDDDKTDSASDGGGGDTDANGGNGNQNGGSDGGDSGGSDGGEPEDGIDCGDTFCTKTKGGLLAQCCAGADEDVCGLDLTAPGQPSLGCFPEDAPGKASPTCAPVLNNFETMGTDPDKFEIDAGGMVISFPTCCSANGTCGVDSSMTSLGDLGLGCLSATVLAPSMMSGGDAGAAADSGAPATSEPNGLPIIPNVFCNPDTGAAATCIPAEVPGMDGTPTKVPPFLLGACAAEVDTADNCIKNVERNIKGCGETTEWDRVSLQGLCISNVANTIYGCDDVSDATLSRLPEFLCGCGEGTTAGPRDVCLSNVDGAVCGTIAVTEKPTCPAGGLICNLPSVLCGCGDGLTALAGAPTLPCLKNIPLDVCGGTAGCTGLPPAETDSCVGPDSCADVAPFTSTKDGVGDSCGCQPAFDPDGPGDNSPPFDTCNPGGAAPGTAAGQFDCTAFGQSNRCSCGTVGQVGTCVEGSICTDTNADTIGDSCVAAPPT